MGTNCKLICSAHPDPTVRLGCCVLIFNLQCLRPCVQGPLCVVKEFCLVTMDSAVAQCPNPTSLIKPDLCHKPNNLNFFQPSDQARILLDDVQANNSAEGCFKSSRLNNTIVCPSCLQAGCVKFGVVNEASLQVPQAYQWKSRF